MEALGTHVIAEFFNCDILRLNDIKKVEEIMLKAVDLANATLIKPFFHQFSPYGISGVIVIAESHFTIHTWPEHRYAAVDIFTCGNLNWQIALEHMKKEFKAMPCSVLHIKRGIMAHGIDNEEINFQLLEPRHAEYIKL